MSEYHSFLQVPARFFWADEAACRGVDKDLFFPAAGKNATEAKAICAECPVLEPCREWGIGNETYGIWGGLSERERRTLRRGSTVLRECPICRKTFVTRRAIHKGAPRTVCSDECRERSRVETWRRFNAKVRERRGIAS